MEIFDKEDYINTSLEDNSYDYDEEKLDSQIDKFSRDADDLQFEKISEIKEQLEIIVNDTESKYVELIEKLKFISESVKYLKIENPEIDNT